jgi:hypothetical protein
MQESRSKLISEATDYAHPTRAKAKLDGLTYYRKWNTPDFLGKYHLTKIASTFPIPGSAVHDETEHGKLKLKDVERFENELIEHAKRLRKREKVKKETAEFNTRVFFNAVIKQPMTEAEETLSEKQKVLNGSGPNGDTIQAINRFQKNVRLGRSHYVGYAVSLGFKSIDWQEPEFGNSALHIAIHNGDLEMVEQLMKYKVDPEIKNRLGYSALHYAWSFWKKYNSYDKEEIKKQIEQEKRTVDILSCVLSYGAYPDAQQQDGSSLLHLAAKFGIHFNVYKYILYIERKD